MIDIPLNSDISMKYFFQYKEMSANRETTRKWRTLLVWH